MDGSKSAEQLKQDVSGRILVGKDLCQFFKYLVNILNTYQMDIYSQHKFPAPIHSDVFNLYGGAFANQFLEGAGETQLLDEITAFFQKLFVAQAPPTNTFPVEGPFPILTRIAQAARGPVDPSTLVVLNNFGSLSEYSLGLTEGRLGLVKGIEGIPLVVLVMKYLQLVREDILGRYSSVLTKCGISSNLVTDNIPLSQAKKGAKNLGIARAESQQTRSAPPNARKAAAVKWTSQFQEAEERRKAIEAGRRARRAAEVTTPLANTSVNDS